MNYLNLSEGDWRDDDQENISQRFGDVRNCIS